jgi:hypothetical protein
MRAWTGSALNGYYSDPLVVFLAKGARANGGLAVTKAGYFVTPHCDPDCCAAFGGISTADFGPFATAGAARDWSRTHLVETR